MVELSSQLVAPPRLPGLLLPSGAVVFVRLERLEDVDLVGVAAVGEGSGKTAGTGLQGPLIGVVLALPAAERLSLRYDVLSVSSDRGEFAAVGRKPERGCLRDGRLPAGRARGGGGLGGLEAGVGGHVFLLRSDALVTVVPDLQPGGLEPSVEVGCGHAVRSRSGSLTQAGTDCCKPSSTGGRQEEAFRRVSDE